MTQKQQLEAIRCILSTGKTDAKSMASIICAAKNIAALECTEPEAHCETAADFLQAACDLYRAKQISSFGDHYSATMTRFCQAAHRYCGT